MPPPTFPQKFYSLRYENAVVDASIGASGPDAASLAAIEAQMLDANQAFWKRRYQDAIADYQQAAGKIYALLDPQFTLVSLGAIALPRDPGLFEGFVSVSAEYLNVLPVNQPSAGPPPRVAVDPALLVGNGKSPVMGIQSMQLASRNAAGALASWRLAQNYSALGMPESAAHFTAQAQAADPKVVQELERGSAGGNGPESPAGSDRPEKVAGWVGSGQTADANGPGPGATALTPPTSVAGLGALPTLSAEALLSDAPAAHVSEALQAGTRTPLPTPFLEGRTAATTIGGESVQLAWPGGSAVAPADIVANVYQARVGLQKMPDILLEPLTPTDVALSLPHLYYYVIPLALAECYQALGDYAQAESEYLQAASYQYINVSVESPYIFVRLATLYLDWGNSLFKNGQPSDARQIYSNVVTPDWQVPTGQLYSVTGIKPGADVARQVIAALPSVSGLALDPQIIAVILEVRQQLLKIAGGLDYWGIWEPCVPIWTFDYLQQVAVNFTQLAVSAERDVINFWNNADQATLTRQELSGAVDQANAEVNAQQMAVNAASAEQTVYNDGVTLANQRAADAKSQANEYQSLSSQWIVHQALNAQLNGGDDGDAGQLNGYANAMMSGSYSLSGSRGTLAAAEQLTAARENQKYEVDALNNTAAELQTAAVQAQDEATAAAARTAAAQAGLQAAQTRANDATNDLAVFDDQTFTPDVWNRLGTTMFSIYNRYFEMALRAARLMQQAYNFETDQSLSLIKSSYAADEVSGLLGADLLMADIQSFTYDLITGTNTKPQPVKQTISLAQRFGYLFESQFRKTGMMDFTTTLDDFDAAYPGTYAGRIETVEVEVDGIVPPTGISGLLTNSGISTYRVPSSAWTETNDGRKIRVQPRETLVISDYSPRTDELVDPTDSRMMRIFEGAGPASDWHFELLPSINDLDYGAIADVKLTFSYMARFDADLHDRVLQEITSRPGFNARQRGIPLRWVFPDEFFVFQRTGTLSWELRNSDFPLNETSPMLTDVGLVVATTGSVAASNITFGLSTPTHAAVNAATDATGSIESDTVGSAWAPLGSGTAVGSYQLEVTAVSNPQLVQNGALDLSGIVNVGFVLGYTFTAR
jgi:tetratricopeptide (TPR) repeat protein